MVPGPTGKLLVSHIPTGCLSVTVSHAHPHAPSARCTYSFYALFNTPDFFLQETNEHTFLTSFEVIVEEDVSFSLLVQNIQICQIELSLRSHKPQDASRPSLACGGDGGGWPWDRLHLGGPPSLQHPTPCMGLTEEKMSSESPLRTKLERRRLIRTSIQGKNGEPCTQNSMKKVSFLPTTMRRLSSLPLTSLCCNLRLFLSCLQQ